MTSRDGTKLCATELFKRIHSATSPLGSKDERQSRGGTMG